MYFFKQSQSQFNFTVDIEILKAKISALRTEKNILYGLMYFIYFDVNFMCVFIKKITYKTKKLFIYT